MRTVHCPLCGLRYQHLTELDQHVRDEHAPAAAPEGQVTISVPRSHRPGPAPSRR